MAPTPGRLAAAMLLMTLIGPGSPAGPGVPADPGIPAGAARPGAGGAARALHPTGFEVGQVFPGIVLPSAGDGTPVPLARFRGRKTILHVFASW